MPIITSLSTRFLGHPRLTNPTFVAGDLGASELTKDDDFDDMQSFYFSILITIRQAISAIRDE
jgi:hypothetical protein